ncbi:hypothetical protein [Gordonia malaquae]|uniref:hypothetical protein n=1 Tax=Gordonia malaquae TaxID=410332 RepID=UPI00301826A6
MGDDKVDLTEQVKKLGLEDRPYQWGGEPTFETIHEGIVAHQDYLEKRAAEDPFGTIEATSRAWKD